LTYILPLTVWVYLHSNFSDGLRKIPFSQECVVASLTLQKGFFTISFKRAKRQALDTQSIWHTVPYRGHGSYRPRCFAAPLMSVLYP